MRERDKVRDKIEKEGEVEVAKEGEVEVVKEVVEVEWR